MTQSTLTEIEIKSLIKNAAQKHQSGQLQEAKLLYKEIFQNFPGSTDLPASCIHLYPLILTDYGRLLQKLGQSDQAIQFYQQAIELDPELIQAQINLGTIFQTQERLVEAAQAYQNILGLNPHLAEVHNGLGIIYKKQKQDQQAIEHYQKAIEISPNFVEAYNNLGIVLKNQGRISEALAAYQQALRIKPDFDMAKFGLCMTQLPIIYQDTEEILWRRSCYQNHLQKLADEYDQSSLDQQSRGANIVGTMQPFYLAYQGLNDRELQHIYGSLICQLMAVRYPNWSQPIPLLKPDQYQKIRVGFVSSCFYHHSVWKIPIKGWIENIDREQFELFGYHTNSKQDQETVEAAQAFVQFTQGTFSVDQWAEKIHNDQLHVLIFPEIGMEPLPVQIACLKLAPIQMVFGGHPETTGLPTIDYHLTSDLMEPKNGQDHYTETLVRLPNLGVCYTPLKTQPRNIKKKDIGMPENQVMFWCCQSLFKYLPQHDDIFPQIAQRLDKGRFVFIRHDSEVVNQIFYTRLELAFQKYNLSHEKYCIFLPRLKARMFAGVTALADVFLDNIGWSGNNTIMESTLYNNVPIVTWPGTLMRSRHAKAILDVMGIVETIASSKADYIEIAIRLGEDSAYRRSISEKVNHSKHKLYNDLTPVRALEDFLNQVVRQPKSLPDWQHSEARVRLNKPQLNESEFNQWKFND
ncbi:MAG: tetratricopeptide repeat protein [Oscillatoriales cyanobacterium RM2_1_1]|nr:tetratricopeptide repeat protein [Oscillatoriales cyanobacterium SM2_3_0]NJO44321.1 tetratricopeptide repeat protein [Oscillatoriales cyanobacterium RM2_1_1]